MRIASTKISLFKGCSIRSFQGELLRTSVHLPQMVFEMHMRFAVQHRVSTSFYSLEPNVIHSTLLVFVRRASVLHISFVLCHPCTGSMRPQCDAAHVKRPPVWVCFGTRPPEPARNATPPARVAYRTSTFISQTQPQKERQKVSFHTNAERDTHCTMHK